MVKKTARRRHRGGEETAEAPPVTPAGVPAEEKSWFGKLKDRIIGPATAGRRRRGSGSRKSRRRHGGVEPTAPPASLTGPGIPAPPSTASAPKSGKPGSATAMWAPSRGGRKSRGSRGSRGSRRTRRRVGGDDDDLAPAFGFDAPEPGSSGAFGDMRGPSAPLGSPGASDAEPLAPVAQAEAPKNAGRRRRRKTRRGARKH